MKWIIRIATGLGLLIALPLLLAILFSRGGSQSNGVDWPGGKKLNILQITYGNQHQYGSSVPISILSEIIPGFPGQRRIHVGTLPESLVVWVNLHDAKHDESLPITNIVQVIARDGDGSRYVTSEIITRDQRHWQTQPAWGNNPNPPPTSEYFHTSIVLTQYPKDKEVFDLDLLNRDGDVVATLPIRNPIVKKAQDWKPDPLPIQRQRDQLGITLQSFTNNWRIMTMHRQQYERPTFIANFDFEYEGAPSGDWVFDSGRIEDALGNSVSMHGHEAGNVSLNSSAWKISFDFLKSTSASFPPKLVWEQVLDIPAKGKAKQLNLEKTLMDIPVKLIGITGPQTQIVMKDGKLDRFNLDETISGSSVSSRANFSGNRLVETVTIKSKDAHIGTQIYEQRHRHRIHILAKNKEGRYEELGFHYRASKMQFAQIRGHLPQDKIQLKIIVQPVFQDHFFVKPSILPPAHQFIPAKQVPSRDTAVSETCIDLSPYYTSNFKNSIYIRGQKNNSSFGASFDLRRVKTGVTHLDGVDWDLRGMVLLTGTTLHHAYLNYPASVESIRMNTTASELHFLQGCLWISKIGKEIGSYVVHYENGSQETIPLVYGENIANLWNQQGTFPEMKVTQATKVLLPPVKQRQGNTPSTSAAYHFTWKNPHPDQRISHLEFKSERHIPAPILLGLTVKPSSRQP